MTPHHQHKDISGISFIACVAMDLFRGFHAFRNIGPTVTILGSARINEKHPYYTLTMDIASQIAKSGYTVITGAGPGLMEAANRGAKEAGGRSLGANIILPHEQTANRYVDECITFKTFTARKNLFARISSAFVVMPGGFGTLDEMTDILNIAQTTAKPKTPIILAGTDYWSGLYEWMKNSTLAHKMISAEDMGLLSLEDNPQEILKKIKSI